MFVKITRITLPILMLMLLLLPARAEDQPDAKAVEALLQRFTKSYGGIRDDNRLVTLRLEGVQIQGGKEYRIDVHRKRPFFLRHELAQGESRVTGIFDGRNGWLRTKGDAGIQVEELSGSQLAVLRAEARFDSPLYRHHDKPENKIALAGRQRIGSVETFVLRVVDGAGSISLYYMHPENSQILRIEELDENGAVTMQTLYRDYREVDGYAFAFEIENRVSGETLSLTRLERVQVNPGLLSFLFEKPVE